MFRAVLLAFPMLLALPAAAEDAPFAKEPTVAWERDVGGRGGDRIAPLGDSFFAAAGYLLARPGLARNAWLVRIDSDGELIWRRSFGNEGDAAIHALIADKSAIAAAGSRVAGERGEDGWLLQLR